MTDEQTAHTLDGLQAQIDGQSKAIAKLQTALAVERGINQRQQRQIARLLVLAGVAMTALFAGDRLEKLLGGSVLDTLNKIQEIALAVGAGGMAAGGLSIANKSDEHGDREES